MIKIKIANGTQLLKFTPSVLARFDQHRQIAVDAPEVGGQLFARFVGNEIEVCRATGPNLLDKKTRHTFQPSIITEKIAITAMYLRGLHYVGEWHTHPELVPTPSYADRRSIEQTFQKSDLQLAGILLVIVGQADQPDGLFISIQDKRTLHKISI